MPRPFRKGEERIINHSLLGVRETFKVERDLQGHLFYLNREPSLHLDILSHSVKITPGF